MTLLSVLSWSMARLLRAWRANRDGAAVFDHVDSAMLDRDAFHSSDSMGLDGAPSMVFLDAMPPYSSGVDRPSERRG